MNYCDFGRVQKLIGMGKKGNQSQTVSKAYSPSFLDKARVVWGFAIFASGSILRAVFSTLTDLVLCRGYGGSAKPDERFVPVLSGLVYAYINFIYYRCADLYHRPLASSVGRTSVVVDRERGKFGEWVEKGRAECLNFSSYNYLGFGGVDPYCTPKVKDAILKYGCGTPFAAGECGTPDAVRRLERNVAKFLGKEDCVVVGMGFATNSWTLPVLVGPGCLVVSDALNHASIVEGAKGSGAKVKVAKHNDTHDMDRVLSKAIAEGQPRQPGEAFKPWRKILIVVEGIYSMEGYYCRLPEVVHLKKKYHTYLYLDEAHSIGAVGQAGLGVTHQMGVDPSDVDIMMGTFSKSFGGCGGYVAGDASVIRALREGAAYSLHGMAMSLPVAIQVRSALEVLTGEDGSTRGQEKIDTLARNSRMLHRGLEERGYRILGHITSPIIPLMLDRSDPGKTEYFLRDGLTDDQMALIGVGPPAVSLFGCRIRMCVSAAHTVDDVVKLIDWFTRHRDRLNIPITPVRPLQALADKDMPLQRAGDLFDFEDGASFQAPCTSGWRPEPLSLSFASKISSLASSTITDEDWDKLAFATYDLLGLRLHPAVLRATVAAVDRYGVGASGPRQFYGSMDVHFSLENLLAKFMNAEAAILYSYGLNTVTNVIPAFVRPCDVAVCDEAVSFQIRAGLKLSRCRVKYYKNNDVDHLEEVLREVESEDGLGSISIDDCKRRRFIICEGVYQSTGSSSPLANIVHLKKQYCCYVIMDDTLGFGVRGATGRGSIEACGVNAEDIDLMCVSLECAAASLGGFCCSTKAFYDYHILASTTYVFTCAQPPFAAAGCVESLKAITDSTAQRQTLASNSNHFHARMAESKAGVAVTGDPGLAVAHISVASDEGDEHKILNDVIGTVRSECGYHLVLVENTIGADLKRTSIRVLFTSEQTKKQITALCDAICTACKRHLRSDHNCIQQSKPDHRTQTIACQSRISGESTEMHCPVFLLLLFHRLKLTIGVHTTSAPHPRYHNDSTPIAYLIRFLYSFGSELGMMILVLGVLWGVFPFVKSGGPILILCVIASSMVVCSTLASVGLGVSASSNVTSFVSVMLIGMSEQWWPGMIDGNMAIGVYTFIATNMEKPSAVATGVAAGCSLAALWSAKGGSEIFRAVLGSGILRGHWVILAGLAAVVSHPVPTMPLPMSRLYSQYVRVLGFGTGLVLGVRDTSAGYHLAIADPWSRSAVGVLVMYGTHRVLTFASVRLTSAILRMVIGRPKPPVSQSNLTRRYHIRLFMRAVSVYCVWVVVGAAVCVTATME